jgi:AcrR family transcriptional regulator
VEAYLRVVAREGMEQATSRALAGEVGMSSGALWHYFAGFDEVLVQAYALIVDRTIARIAERASGVRGLPALTRTLTELFPLEDVTEAEAAVIVSFWGRVPHNRALGECHAKFEHEWRELLREHLDVATSLGQLSPLTPLTAVADALYVVAAGLQVEHVVSAAITDAARQWGLVAALLAPWLTDEGHEAHAMPVDTRALVSGG